jgi:hypothetical protein
MRTYYANNAIPLLLIMIIIMHLDVYARLCVAGSGSNACVSATMHSQVNISVLIGVLISSISASHMPDWTAHRSSC